MHFLFRFFWPHNPFLLIWIFHQPQEPLFAFGDEQGAISLPFLSIEISCLASEHIMSQTSKSVLYECRAQVTSEDGDALTGFLTQFLFTSLVAMKILTVVSPVLLRILFHRAAIWLQLLVQATAVNEDRLAGLRIPSSLSKHLLQLFKCVAAFPLPNTMLLHTAVTPAKGLRQKTVC